MKNEGLHLQQLQKKNIVFILPLIISILCFKFKFDNVL